MGLPAAAEQGRRPLQQVHLRKVTEMTDFKVGDRVRVTSHHILPTGATGTVAGPGKRPDTMLVDWDAEWNRLQCGGWRREAFELIEPGVIQPGDYVRVTIEGTYEGGDGFITPGVHKDDERDWEYASGEGDTVTVEKVEPPVVVFKPGDRIRRKLTNGWDIPYEITVADEGYLQHHSGGRVVWRGTRLEFTSEDFEKVHLAEVPF